MLPLCVCGGGEITFPYFLLCKYVPGSFGTYPPLTWTYRYNTKLTELNVKERGPDICFLKERFISGSDAQVAVQIMYCVIKGIIKHLIIVLMIRFPDPMMNS